MGSYIAAEQRVGRGNYNSLLGTKRLVRFWFGHRVAAVWLVWKISVARASVCNWVCCVWLLWLQLFVTAVVEEILLPILFGHKVVILVSELGGEGMWVVEGF